MKPTSRLRRLASLGSRFLIVGGLSTLIEIGVFNLLVFVWGWDVVAAKVVASLVALVNAYFGNREWTFRHRDRRGRMNELLLFLLTNALCTAIGAGLVWLGVEMAAGILGRTPGAIAVNAVNLVSIVIVVVLRFALYHSIVFRSPAQR
ncbi:GtrA family protein [Microbacterium sp. NPDC087591]|jgi:putative flippase GtrA|uniref:GtrA family protein n=1 Tax=Microbacterium sp. NPDC087591 TaxID=3364192 RepID=UPI003819358B